ncbi:MAG: NAD(P)H:quinone oxidoreductase, type IV, partial [Actinomycetota bacterium]
MSTAKIVIAFYSTYGTNAEMARIAADAATEAGAEVRLRRIPETAPQEVIDSQEPWKAQQEAQAEIPEITPDDLEHAQGSAFPLTAARIPSLR